MNIRLTLGMPKGPGPVWLRARPEALGSGFRTNSRLPG